jgi:hypothetical protein
MAAHTFVFGERVMLPNPDNFYPEPRYGIVDEKVKKVEGAFGYYFTAEYYIVKSETTGERLRIPAEELEKVPK